MGPSVVSNCVGRHAPESAPRFAVESDQKSNASEGVLADGIDAILLGDLSLSACGGQAR